MMTKSALQKRVNHYRQLLKGISFAQEDLAKAPPVSAEREAYLRKISSEAMKEVIRMRGQPAK